MAEETHSVKRAIIMAAGMGNRMHPLTFTTPKPMITVNGSRMIDTIIDGDAKNFDVGCFNGRYFSYIASFGAFTSTSYSVPQTIKNMLGHTAYILGGIKDILTGRQMHCYISLTCLSQVQVLLSVMIAFFLSCSTIKSPLSIFFIALIVCNNFPSVHYLLF